MRLIVLFNKYQNISAHEYNLYSGPSRKEYTYAVIVWNIETAFWTTFSATQEHQDHYFIAMAIYWIFLFSRSVLPNLYHDTAQIENYNICTGINRPIFSPLRSSAPVTPAAPFPAATSPSTDGSSISGVPATHFQHTSEMVYRRTLVFRLCFLKFDNLKMLQKVL